MPKGSATENLLENGARSDFDGAPAQARGVVEFVAVETGGAGKKKTNGAPDQKGAQDMHERQFDPLAEENQSPAVHGGQDAEKANRGSEGGEGPEDRRVDGVQLIENQIPCGNRTSRPVGHRPEQEQPDHSNGQIGLEEIENPAAPGLLGHAAEG